jgi:glycosyltransferase involved in cell wall biosynthesis
MCLWVEQMMLRVLYFGTYDMEIPRNRMMIEGLRSAGAIVVECHVPLWKGTVERVAAATSAGKWFSLTRRLVQCYVCLMRTYWPLRRSYDAMVLGYPGQFDAFLGRLLCWVDRRPLVLDVYISLYLAASERGLPARNLLRWIEGVACRLPDLLIIDTAEYADWFEKTYGITKRRFRLVPVGADNHLFRPLPRPQPNGIFRVVYHGSFIPLHGIEYILQAAALLRKRSEIRFELIGRGPMLAKAQALAADLRLHRQVRFLGWIDREALLSHLAAADVVLGVFGTTEASRRTIQNKIFEGLAMARPVITGDSPAIRTVFRHAQQVYLVERANPAALANAILTLQSNRELREHLADVGHRLFQERFTVESIGRETRRHIETLLASWRP